jgi:hypothetical protein
VNPDYPNIDPASYGYSTWVERTAVRLGHGPETQHADTPLHPRVRRTRARALKAYMMDAAQKQAYAFRDRLLGD